LLAGTSTARSNFFGTTLSSLTQIEGTGGSTARGSLSVLNNDVSNNPPYVLLGRSGAATLGSNAVVVSGSRLGTLTFHGADGTSFIEAATVAGEVDGTPGSNDMPGRLVFSTTSDNAGSPTERMRLDSSGRLGLGTSAPEETVDVNGAITWRGSLNTGKTSAGALDRSGNELRIRAYGATAGTGQLVFRTGGGGGSVDSEAMRIDSSQRVGIGTTGPTQLLSLASASGNSYIEVAGGGYTLGTNSVYYGQDSSGNGVTWNRGNNYLLFGTNNTERVRIDNSGRLLVGTSTALSTNTGALLQLYGTGGSEFVGSSANNNPAAGDPITMIRGLSQSGSSYGTCATIAIQSDATTSLNDYPGRIVFSTTADGAASSTERMRLSANGAVRIPFIYTDTTATAANVVVLSDGYLLRSTSSRKYKTDIETIEDSYSDALLECRPVWYRSVSQKDNPDWGWWGFIAEEVAEIDPRLVIWKTTEVVYDDKGSASEVPCDPEPEGVAYDRFVPHLLNLIKRQGEAIADLQAEVAALKGA
jgi:hypothetical protein